MSVGSREPKSETICGILLRRNFSRSDLLLVKKKAFRRRLWFKIINQMERGLINAVVRIVEVVRSRLLNEVLRSIVGKLTSALESRVKRMMREIGQPLAQKISFIASSWGNESAEKWISDKGFIQHLTVTLMNIEGSKFGCNRARF